MSDIKLTKNELRVQQTKLQQLAKYLPTLQLKKAMLQQVVALVKEEIGGLDQEIDIAQDALNSLSPLFAENQPLDFQKALDKAHIRKTYENIAGVDIPQFQAMIFPEYGYSLFSTPVWVDNALDMLKKAKTLQARRDLALEKKRLLEEELRQVSIRVNLFEKVLIPRHIASIKKIRIFLGDLALSAISMAKSAKNLLEKKRKEEDLCS